MNNVKKFTLGMAVFLCSSSAVLADSMNSDSSWYISPTINALNPDNKFGVDKDDVGIGFRAGKAVTPDWDIQWGTSYSRIRDNSVRYQQNLFGVDALYMFSRSQFRPFLLVGVGAERDKVNSSSGEKTDTSPYINAGLGFQYAFNDKMALQADYRRVHGFLGGNDFGFKTVNNDYLNVGLNFSFGPH